MIRGRLFPGLNLVAALILLSAVALVHGAMRWTVYRPVGLPYAVATEHWPDMRIDINTAAACELELLPGIGPLLAEAIVSDRQSKGPFATIDHLERVHNIGPRRISQIRPYVVVSMTSTTDTGH